MINFVDQFLSKVGVTLNLFYYIGALVKKCGEQVEDYRETIEKVLNKLFNIKFPAD